MDDAAVKKILQGALASFLDDPEQFREVILRACQRNPEATREALEEFGVLGEVHQIIRDNAPKVAHWVADEALGKPIRGATNQFVNHTVEQVKSHLQSVRLAMIDNLNFIETTMKEKYPECSEDIAFFCKTARSEIDCEVEVHSKDLIGTLKTQAWNVGDVANMIVQNAMLSLENRDLRDGKT